MRTKLFHTLFILFSFIGLERMDASSIRASEFGWNKLDATRAFHEAIRSGADTILIDRQSGDWIVGPGTFEGLQKKTIIFEPGVVLRAKENAFPRNTDCMIKLSHARDVKLEGYGATIRMNKSEYAAMDDGEWRHSISLLDCSNIEIYGFYLVESGGDGIYIRGDASSENILLKDIWCDLHYRQGISVISARKLIVKNCWFTNTSGTLPECGLDLEPNKNTDILEEILFEDCRFTGNYGNGTLLALVKLDSSSIPIDIQFRNCYYSGNRHETNRYGGGAIRLGAAKSGAVEGNVCFSRCMVENSQWAAVSIRKPANAYQATFDDCVFVNVSKDIARKHNSPVWIEVTDYHNSCPRFGGVTFNNCLLSYDSQYPLLGSFGNESTSPGLGNVVLNNFHVVHPSPDIDIDVTSGGGSPDNSCVFDTHIKKSLPSTTISLMAEGNLNEGEARNAFLQTNREADQIDFPLGVSYTMDGAAIQGVDYSRQKGFLIIPSFLVSGKDSINVLNDRVTEDKERITITMKATPLYSVCSEPLSIFVVD